MDTTTSTAPFFVKPELTPERKEFYARLGTRNMAPLWEVFGALFPPQPTPQTAPVLWRYDEARALLLEAGGLLTPKEAERRVIVLENPGLHGLTRVTNS